MDNMASSRVRRLLVIEKNKLQGIITATDLLANSDIINSDLFL